MLPSQLKDGALEKLLCRISALTALMVGLMTCQAVAEQSVRATDLVWPVGASYAAPTNRYDHNIMGRIRGWSRLEVDVAPCSTCKSGGSRIRIDQPQARVFEDFAPRLWDITGDGRPEVVVVESDVSKGSRLAVWEVIDDTSGPVLRRLAMTAYLGTKYRWLAPIGAADFDHDGTIEIAYVEKPHLSRVLRLVRLEGNQLTNAASLAGVTNHAIGQEQVESLVRTCGAVPEIIALSEDGQQVLAIIWGIQGLSARQIGKASNRLLPAGLEKC
jgi:hypothetical protein